MNKELKYLLFLIWISYLLLAAVFTFTRGFLLMKISQETYSECSSVEKYPCDSYDECTMKRKLENLLKNVNTSTDTCLPKSSKVILVIIDALKYEFVQYVPELRKPLAYQNKLPIIDELLKKYPKSTRLMEFIADPPTTTMQRLKALTTGSLPTFVDAGSNFAAAKISEDNFIHQLVKHRRTTIFMGDDTWSSLYPNSFLRSYPYPSFDVFDLDSVDKGIKKDLPSEIRNQGWDLIIAHFLGVDHCGHRYGPLHSEMSRKLQEMNEVISDVVKDMDDNTVLFVIGDHGMTITGDHGGDSEAEVKSALFAYTNSEFISSELVHGKRSVKQIDIVPTISAILGIPIPFSNLGSIILDALPVSHNLPYNDWQYSLLLLWSNVKQVTDYILNYSDGSNQFHDDKISIIRQKFEILSHRVKSISNEMAFKSFAKDAQAYISLVRQMCEDVWVQFDSQLMSRGLCLLIFLIFALHILFNGLPISRLSEIMDSSFVANAYSFMLITACGCYIISFLSNEISLGLTIFLTTSIISYVLFAILIVQNWEAIALNFHESFKEYTFATRSLRYLLFLSVCVLFSNSYVVEESQILSFLLTTVVLILIIDTCTNMRQEKLAFNSIRMKLLMLGSVLMILIRVSNFYFRCRPEQTNCSILDIKVLSIDKTTCIVALISMALLTTLTRIWLKYCGNLVGFSPSVLISRYCPTILVVFIGGYWVLKQMPRSSKTTPWQVDILPLSIYTVSVIALILYWMRPLCVYVLPKSKPSAPSIYGRNNIIPQLFNHLKDSYVKSQNAINDNIPIVCGLGTVYSSVFINVGLLTCLPLALLHGVVLSPSLILLFAICLLLSTILAIVRYEAAKNLADLFKVSSISLFAWMLLSLYFFYGTGQQPTFPTLQWEAAFVGMNEGFFTTQNIYIRGLLVTMNTFSSQIIVSFMLPLVLISPFTLYAIFPSLTANVREKDLTRGELNLYEMNDNFIDGVFVATCKYILLQGTRMFASMLAATILCRHLMVWKIFAPKFLFDGFSVLITLIFTVFSFIFVLRINHHVGKLVSKITKAS